MILKRRWQAEPWTRWWVFGLRRGEWWVGVRDNFEADCWEINIMGLTLMVGKH